MDGKKRLICDEGFVVPTREDDAFGIVAELLDAS
jgi:hypothetical protein